MLGWSSTSPESEQVPVCWRLLGVQVTVGQGARTVAAATGETLSQSLQFKASAKDAREKQDLGILANDELQRECLPRATPSCWPSVSVVQTPC